MSDLTKKLRDTERALKLERETVQRISRQRDAMAAEVERLQEQCSHLIQKFKSEIEVSYSKRDSAEKQRDQLKAQVMTMSAAGLQLLGDYGIAIENVMDDWAEEEVQDAWSTRDYLRSAFESEPEQSLADHDADVIELFVSSRLDDWPASLASQLSLEARDYANQIRNKAKEPDK